MSSAIPGGNTGATPGTVTNPEAFFPAVDGNLWVDVYKLRGSESTLRHVLTMGIWDVNTYLAAWVAEQKENKVTSLPETLGAPYQSAVYAAAMARLLQQNPSLMTDTVALGDDEEDRVRTPMQFQDQVRRDLDLIANHGAETPTSQGGQLSNIRMASF